MASNFDEAKMINILHRMAVSEIVSKYFKANNYTLEDTVTLDDVVNLFLAFESPENDNTNKKDLSGEPQPIFNFIRIGMTQPTWKVFLHSVQF